jgi:general secretion pathway protein E
MGAIPWQALYESAFGTPGWQMVGPASGALALAALGLGLVDRWTGRKPSKGRSFDFAGLTDGTMREALEEVQARLRQCVEAREPDLAVGFDELLRGALRVEASDVHLSPQGGDLLVTYRVHGTLYDVALVPGAAGQRLATRVKVLAQLDPYARRPQDGRLQREVSGTRLEARVSTLPADGSQRIVLRLVRGSRAVPDLGALGFEPFVARTLEELLSKPQGLLFVTGPVGSGKTTTLYSALQHIAHGRGRTTSLVTLEDPVELQLPFATQTQINAQVGMSFAHTLRSVLRQDPNVLMLGEIRDAETAEIAAQAGLTGHLLLTTVHANTAAGTFARVTEMGVEPFILASAAIGALSQRLVRTLCTSCRKVEAPGALVRERFARLGIHDLEGEWYEAAGCEYCEGQGFTGRTPIAELLVVSSEIGQAIHQRIPTEELHQLAVAQGMVPLVQSGLDCARRGITSLSEVVRVVG